jgi:serine/threonine-protein kinase HipA
MKFQPVTLLRVLLADGNRTVGRLVARDGRIWFEYATSFLTTALQLSPFGLPLRAGVFEGPRTPFEGLHGVFDDSLPDGWGRLLLEREMDRLGVGRARLRPLDRLAWIGRTGMGALAFEPEIEGPRPPAIIDLSRLAAHAREVLEGEADALVPELLAVGGSPGGARPKAVVWLRTDDTAIHGREDPAAEAWLVKFRSREDPPDAGAVEFAYLELARRAGLEVPQSRLFGRGSGEPGFLGVRRFDRKPGGRRIHVHTFCGLLHADHRVPSATYEDLLAATRALTRDERQVRDQFRRMVFNVLAHNRDDHTRNHAFMMEDDGRWHLAPAYDLTFASGPGGEHSMTIGGEGRDPDEAAMRRCADKIGLATRDVEDAFGEVREALLGWDELADELGITQRIRRLVRRTMDLQ